MSDEKKRIKRFAKKQPKMFRVCKTAVRKLSKRDWGTKRKKAKVLVQNWNEALRVTDTRLAHKQFP